MSRTFEEYELITDSVARSCKFPAKTSQDHKMPCKLTWLRNYLRQVAIKTSLQPWMCFQNFCLLTLPQIKMPKQLQNIQSTSWLSTHTCRQRSFLIIDQLLSLVVEEEEDVLDFTLDHATTKHVQKIWTPEKSYASLAKVQCSTIISTMLS